MKKLNFINCFFTIINIMYIIFINVFYIQLPVPNKIYLRDIKTGGMFPNSFINIGIFGLLLNIIISIIYLILNKNNIRGKNIKVMIVFISLMFIIIGLIYQKI